MNLKKFVKKVSKAATKPVTGSAEAVYHAAKGDFKKAKSDLLGSIPGVESYKQLTGQSTEAAAAQLAAIATMAYGASGLMGTGTAASSAAEGASAASALGETPLASSTGLLATGGLLGAGGTAALSGGAGGLMGSILGGAASGTIGNILGSAASAATSYAGAKYAADKSAQSAQQINERQIAWERERATNAHQWEVQDLKNAGLNPVLSAGGQGAATGGISAVQPDTSGYQSAGQAIKGFFDLLNSNRLANAQADSINAQTISQLLQNKYIEPTTKAQLANTVANTKLNNANSAQALSNISLNAAKATEALSTATFNKRRASGKYINGQLGLHGKVMGQEVGGNIGIGVGY